MASNDMISTEAVTTCDICHDKFVDPRLLPCSHTYCLRCIKRNAASHNDQFECPLNDGTKVTKNLIDSLPLNETMSDVIDFLDSTTDLIQCSNCQPATSEYWCKKCNHFCAECSHTIHNTIRAFLNHERVSLPEKAVELIPCEKHPDEKLKYWCQKCSNFVCSDCLLRGHKDHSYATLNQVAEELEAKVNNDLSNIKLTLDVKIDETDMSLTTVNAYHSSNKDRITGTMKHLQQIIDEHANEMLQKIQRIETTENTRMNDFKIRLENELRSLNEQKQNLDILLSSKDQTKLMRGRQGFLSYINRINRILDGLRVPAKHEYRVEGIEQLQNIRESILQCGRIVEDLRQISGGTTYHNPQLEKLIADNQTENEWDLGSRILTDRDMEIIADALQNNANLTKLQLSQGQIDDQGIEHLATGLKQNQTLTTLCLYENKIGDYGAQHLADALQRNKALTTLDLYRNEISDQGIQHLADMLRQNKTLVTLHLSENRIGDQGAAYLADALRQNRRLKTIHLSQNQIGDRGAEHLADALTHNTKLTVLNLYSNEIGDDGAQCFADALRRNRTLTTLYLSNNRIGDNGATQLADALGQNTTLTTLSLHQNPIDQQAKEHAKDILKTNNQVVVVNW